MVNGDATRKDLFFLAAILFQTVVIGWLVIQVSQMRGNRFTSGDGLAIWQALSEKADSDDYPPDWLTDKVDEMEVRIRELERQH